MEFLTANILNTTTMISVSSNSAVQENLFNRDPYYQYYSDGDNNDNTTTSITITFDATTSVSRLGLMDINFKEFYAFYNGATANSITITNGDTTTLSYTGNADTNKYFRFSTLACTSITICAKKTITADQEKVMGELVISDLYFALTLIPNSKGFKPKVQPKQVVHKLSDGGARIHNVARKWEHELDLKFVGVTQSANLLSLYEMDSEFNFCPFGTTTSWDAVLYEAIWDGPFGFYEYSDNAISSGFTGRVLLKETPF